MKHEPIDKEYLYNELKRWYDENAHKEVKSPLPDSVGIIVKRICDIVMTYPQFNKLTGNWREEAILNGIQYGIVACNKFNPHVENSNPFSYIMYYVSRGAQTYVTSERVRLKKNMEQMFHQGEFFDTCDLDKTSTDYGSINESLKTDYLEYVRSVESENAPIDSKNGRLVKKDKSVKESKLVANKKNDILELSKKL